MTKKNSILILFLSFLFLTTGCKKDYPKDIPKWLKQMIDKKEKECKNKKNLCPCIRVDKCWSIYEWKENDKTYYILDHGWTSGNSFIDVSVFDEEGNNIEDGAYNIPPNNAGENNSYLEACTNTLQLGHITRTIWEQKKT
jgi:hypothetical protein